MTNTDKADSKPKKDPRGRPTLPPEEKRLAMTFRVNQEERRLIKENAGKAGMSVSQYLRMMTLEYEPG